MWTILKYDDRETNFGRELYLLVPVDMEVSGWQAGSMICDISGQPRDESMDESHEK